MQRMYIAAAVAVLAVGSGLSGTVRAGGIESANPVAAEAAHSASIPDYLKPVPMAVQATANPSSPSSSSALTIDVPINGTIYPPDIIPPQFEWRDANSAATVWRVEIAFGGHARSIKVWSNGEKMQIGPSDNEVPGYVPPTLTPEQAVTHTWRPDAKTWDEIKKLSVEQPATIIISGYASQKEVHPLSQAQATIHTSKDPVAAPIFFRDVPLITPTSENIKGGVVIKPLPDSLVPSIKYRLRSISEPQSKTLMTGLPTCANCHSFSADGKTFGMDIDGPANDKGLYAVVPVQQHMSIGTKDLVHWNTDGKVGTVRVGFMSQVSPNGRYVVSTFAGPSLSKLIDSYYVTNFKDYRFIQVFYPTRGILEYYDRTEGRREPLPGADDPTYVQTDGVWNPDGKWIVFARAEARPPRTPDQTPAEYANDPNETQIQYDLYKIPFNDGKGGTPERIVGASQNGMSNSFPKVSPDGKWIVFVQCKNGQLMRPDSQLYIVPFEGGTARRMNANTRLMNSWNSFSPNGRWLVFSSKSRSPYTQMFLTHIDENGNDSPPVLIENATAANRAVNIPEFVNIAPGGIADIATPAVDFYKAYSAAAKLSDAHKYSEAIPVWQHAIELGPDDARPHNFLGVALAATGNTSEAIDEYNKSLAINPNSSQTLNNLGGALADSGKLDEALVQIRKAIALDPSNGDAYINLGHVLDMSGQRQEALDQLTKGIQLAPKSYDGYNILGVILARMGRLDDAIAQLQKAVELAPESADSRYNLGRAYAASNRFPEALEQFEAAAKITNGQEPSILRMLAGMYSETAQYPKAVTTAQQAIQLATQQHNSDLTKQLQSDLERYQLQVSAQGPGGAH